VQMGGAKLSEFVQKKQGAEPKFQETLFVK
jgi:hypothetical protein